MHSFTFLSLILMFIVYTEAHVLVVPKVHSDVIRDAITKCAPEEDISEFYTLVREGKYRKDENFKQLVFCSYIKSGFAHSDGRLNEEAATHVFPNDAELVNAIRNCDKKGTTEIETNWMSFKCFQDTSPVHFQL